MLLPSSATNNAPGGTARESTTTRENRSPACVAPSPAPAQLAPRQPRAPRASVSTLRCHQLDPPRPSDRAGRRLLRRWNTVVRQQLLSQILEHGRGHDAAVQLLWSVQSDQHREPRLLGGKQRHQRPNRQRRVVAHVRRRIRRPRLDRDL